MKKIFLIGTAVLGMFFMTTSCLDNTEPAGIEAMRTAKSELIRAQAEYQQALAAYQQAQIAITEAEAAALLLENQMKELELQQKQLELDLQEAKNEHEIRMMELEYLLAQEQNNADIAELQMQIAELELRQLQLELDMLDLENQRELMIQQHELALLNLQATLAETQAYYEETLRNLEAARHGLTEGEQNKLDQYIRQIEAIQAKIDVAENELIAAQNEVVRIKFSYNTDSLRLYNQYTYNVKIAQRTLDEANAELEEVRNLDLTGGAEELLAQKTSIEEQIEQLEGQIEELTLEADAKEYEKEAPEAKIREIEAQILDINNQITALYDQLNGSALEEDEVRELTVPETIARFVGEVVAQNKGNWNVQSILQDFENPDPLAGNLYYTLPGGVFSWRATGSENQKVIVPQLLAGVKEYVLTEPGVLNIQNNLTSYKQSYNAVGGVKDRYENNLKVYRQAKADYAKYAEEYGILNYTHYTTTNLFLLANEAFIDLQTMYQEGTPFDGTAVKDQVTASLEAIRYEQEIRDTLFGNAYPGWENITYANLTSAADAQNHIDFTFVEAAYNNSLTEYNNSLYNEDKRYAYGSVSGSDTTQWSILQRWDFTSSYLYSLPFSEVELTLDYVGYGEYFVFDFSLDRFPDVSWYKWYEIGDDAGRQKLLTDLGYSDLSVLIRTGFLQNYLWQFLIESAEAYIAYNGDFDGVIADLEEMKAELDAVSDVENADAKEVYEQIYALTKQIETLNEQIADQRAVVDSIDVEIAKLTGPTNSEKSVLEGKIFRLENTISILDGIIGGREIEINGMTYNPLDDGLEELQAEYIEYYEYLVDQYELNVQDCQNYLDRLLAAEDPFKQALEDAERALANAQEAYEKLLEEFNYYNELLNDFLTNVLGIGNDDNPEA